MPSFRTGVVTAILSERDGLQRVEVDGAPSYVLTRVVGPVAVGDRVVVNVTAVELGLGTGGWHFVHWNLERSEVDVPGGGHVMKLRYTSLQSDTGVAEEHQPISPCLEGAPIVAIALHSQLAAVAAAVKSVDVSLRVVYVMTRRGALPIALSELVADLRQAGLVDATVTAGHAFGGDEEAVNARSAMGVAHHRLGADVIVAGMGPGSVGTGTELGYSGLEVADLLNGAADMGGRPVIVLRYSDADRRQRHQGISHHSRTALRCVRAAIVVPIPIGASEPAELPDGAEVVEVDATGAGRFLEHHGVNVTSMGRDSAADPQFFAYAAAAGCVAAQVASRDG